MTPRRLHLSAGPGRTATEVQREVAAYRAFMRREHSDNPNFPLFQSDYLFVQLPGKPIFLGRVVHDCCMDDAISPDITFTVGEYAHIAQDRVSGLVGYFTKKPNVSYDPHDKRKGGVFVRHIKMTRDNVVGYNVQTWVDRALLAERAADELEPQVYSQNTHANTHAHSHPRLTQYSPLRIVCGWRGDRCRRCKRRGPSVLYRHVYRRHIARNMEWPKKPLQPRRRWRRRLIVTTMYHLPFQMGTRE